MQITFLFFVYVQILLMKNDASCLSCALRARNLSGVPPQCCAPLRALALGYDCRALRALAASRPQLHFHCCHLQILFLVDIFPVGFGHFE